MNTRNSAQAEFRGPSAAMDMDKDKAAGRASSLILQLKSREPKHVFSFSSSGGEGLLTPPARSSSLLPYSWASDAREGFCKKSGRKLCRSGDAAVPAAPRVNNADVFGAAQVSRLSGLRIDALVPVPGRVESLCKTLAVFYTSIKSICLSSAKLRRPCRSVALFFAQELARIQSVRATCSTVAPAGRASYPRRRGCGS